MVHDIDKGRRGDERDQSRLGAALLRAHDEHRQIGRDRSENPVGHQPLAWAADVAEEAVTVDELILRREDDTGFWARDPMPAEETLDMARKLVAVRAQKHVYASTTHEREFLRNLAGRRRSRGSGRPLPRTGRTRDRAHRGPRRVDVRDRHPLHVPRVSDPAPLHPDRLDDPGYRSVDHYGERDPQERLADWRASRKAVLVRPLQPSYIGG